MWSEETDEEVLYPVGCRGWRHAFGTVTRGIYLTNESPYDGSRSHGEASNEEIGENDHNIADGWSIRAGILIKSERSEGLVINNSTIIMPRKALL
jgi:hypothetical protein